eukprot:COSAG02_NODE_26089_length_641_cov_1.011070_1_plen_80_part_10
MPSPALAVPQQPQHARPDRRSVRRDPAQRYLNPLRQSVKIPIYRGVHNSAKLTNSWIQLTQGIRPYALCHCLSEPLKILV